MDCTALMVTIRVGIDPPQTSDRGQVCHLTCFMYETSPFPAHWSTFLRRCTGTFSLLGI